MGYAQKVIEWLYSTNRHPRALIDHGCGMGFTTLLFAEALPDTLVIGTNYKGLQLDFNNFLLARMRPTNAPDFVDEADGDFTTADVLVCFELFEHFKDPVAELNELMATVKPGVLVDSSSFGIRSPGHFDFYQLSDGRLLKGAGSSQAAQYFGKILRRFGFQDQRDVDIYSGRPRIFVRDREVLGTKGPHGKEREARRIGLLTDVQVAISLLNSESRLTYEQIAEPWERKKESCWAVTDKLVSKGLVEMVLASETPDKRRRFSLSPAGRSYFQTILKNSS
jgi:SAM-dependent methyltransferase